MTHEKVPLPLSKDETKAVLKEALREWLDERLARFGAWTIAGMSSLALAALTYFVLVWNGWRPPS